MSRDDGRELDQRVFKCPMLQGDCLVEAFRALDCALIDFAEIGSSEGLPILLYHFAKGLALVPPRLELLDARGCISQLSLGSCSAEGVRRKLARFSGCSQTPPEKENPSAIPLCGADSLTQSRLKSESAAIAACHAAYTVRSSRWYGRGSGSPVRILHRVELVESVG